jgi:hypothetical protein
VSGGGAAFNIGSQQAGAIYQAAGDQTIQQAGGTLTVGALRAAGDLRTALESTAMPDAVKREVEQDLEAVEAELGASPPDKDRIGGRVERMIGVLSQAGALAGAGESLVSPLRSIASFAGAAGVAALRLLA